MSITNANASAVAAGKPQLPYIDCLRGYAVLMVIACHTTYAFPELPYPVHRLGAFGWHGVQLFFLASCLTLLMSAHHERAKTGALNARNFFIRRFLRIAPMYYLAAGFYWLVWRPADANLPQLLASLAFVNAWHPVTTTTTGAWQVVPGGWSIGVEFTFYFLFPLFAAIATSFKRAALMLAGSLLIGGALNSLLTPVLAAQYGQAAADNFLYFWFFNQAPVFILGAMAYFGVQALDSNPDGRATLWARRWSGALIAAGLGLVLAVATAPLPFSHHLMLSAAVPQYLAASLAFMVFIVGLSQTRRSILINPLIASVGKVSFSAYLLHFAVIKLLPETFPNIFRIHAEGWTAIAAFAACLVVVTLVTYLASLATHALIEERFMRYAKRLTRKPAVPARAATAQSTIP